MCIQLYAMKYVWDPQKAHENFAKHGVRFEEAIAALEDPHALTALDLGHDEIRFVTIGMAFPLILVVVHAERAADLIRIISARKAGRADQRRYFEGWNND